jgi:hypothetical protein
VLLATGVTIPIVGLVPLCQAWQYVRGPRSRPARRSGRLARRPGVLPWAVLASLATAVSVALILLATLPL